MPQVTFTAEVEIYCSCGAGLCNQSSGGEGDVTVDVCGACLDEARAEARDEGDTEGYQRGYDEGLQEGRDEA